MEEITECSEILICHYGIVVWVFPFLEIKDFFYSLVEKRVIEEIPRTQLFPVIGKALFDSTPLKYGGIIGLHEKEGINKLVLGHEYAHILTKTETHCRKFKRAERDVFSFLLGLYRLGIKGGEING